MMFGEFGENFAVQADIGLFQFIHENAVRQTVRSRASVYFYLPQPPEISLLFPQIMKAVDAGVKKRFFGQALF
jgi:hypothetical protein